MLDSTVESVAGPSNGLRASLPRRWPPAADREPLPAPDSRSEDAIVAKFARTRGRTRANGQPAFGAYLRRPQRYPARGRSLRLYFTLTGDRICAMTRFENSVLPWFGLPRSLGH